MLDKPQDLRIRKMVSDWEPAVEPTTVKIDSSRMEELHHLLLKEKQVSEAKTTNRYEAFRMTYAGGLMIGYTSGKIVVNGEQCEALLAKVLEHMDLEESRYDITIGSDEAGKGEWLGPMVVAAVALTPTQSTALRSMGVMDSKALSQKKIAELKEKITANATAVRTVLVSPQTFNKRMEQLHEERKNLNDLLAWAHAKVVGEVYDELKRARAVARMNVVIDEFSKLKTEDRLSRVLSLKQVDVVQRPRAEDEIAVAAASIVARRLREEWIDDWSRRLGIDLRNLTAQEAAHRQDANTIAKTGYLKKTSE